MIFDFSAFKSVLLPLLEQIFFSFHNQELFQQNSLFLQDFLLQEIHQTQDLPHLDYLFTNLISKLRLAKLDELTKIYGIREGLEYKLLKTANEAINLQDFFQKLKSKRYSKFHPLSSPLFI